MIPTAKADSKSKTPFAPKGVALPDPKKTGSDPETKSRANEKRGQAILLAPFCSRDLMKGAIITAAGRVMLW